MQAAACRITKMKKVKRGQIYYADLSPVVGSEQNGFRPVLILQNDTGNKYGPTTIVAPITSTKPDSRMPTHVRVNVEGLVSGSIVLLEQIRTIDKRRLDDYLLRMLLGMELITEEEYNKIVAISEDHYGTKIFSV